ncbi:MAG: hypothetical protein O7C74_05930 [Acidobacteria bacterium]|nr:hypothetical protein [Acidobacteriota bacterium]
MRRRREKRIPSGIAAPTRLNAIQPDLPGRMAALIHAARRWQELAGEELIRRLPLLDVQEGAWVIGLPSPTWEAELARLRRSLVAAGKDVPALVGRVREPGSIPPAAVARRTKVAPPAHADAGRRLRWIMEQMCAGDDS